MSEELLLLEQPKQHICPICQHPLEYYLDGHDFLYKTTPKVFSIYKCINCGLEQIIPTPDTSEIMSFYPPNYYSYQHKNDSKNFLQKLKEKIVDISYNKNSPKNVYYFLAIFLKSLLDGMPLAYVGNKKFLDVGCGDGYTMSVMSQYGWQTTGFEIGVPCKKDNIHYAANFQDIDFGEEKFEYIRVWHVLEHVPEPGPFITKLSAVLAENGCLVLGLPNTHSLYARLFGKYWYNRDVPRHLINYNPHSLKIICAKNNLKIINLKHRSQAGLLGSLQFVLKEKLKINLNPMSSLLLFILLYPIDILCNLFKIGDCISLTVVKENNHNLFQPMLDFSEKQKDVVVNNRVDPDPLIRFARKIAVFFSSLIFHTKIKPNQITIWSFFLFVPLICYLLIQTSWHSNLLALGLIMVYCTIDLVDGVLARSRNTSSRLGAFLDSSLDRIFHLAVLLSLTIGVVRSMNDPRWYFIGFIMFFGQAMADYLGFIFKYRFNFDVYNGSSLFNQKFKLFRDPLGLIDIYIKNIIVPVRFVFILLFTTRYFLIFAILLNQESLCLIAYGITINLRWISMYLLYLRYLYGGKKSSLKTIQVLQELDTKILANKTS